MFIFGIRFEDVERRYGIKRENFQVENKGEMKDLGIFINNDVLGWYSDSRYWFRGINITEVKSFIADFINENFIMKAECIKDNDIKLIMV